MTVMDTPALRPRNAAEETGNRLARTLGDHDTRVRRAAADALIDGREVLVGEEGVQALVQAAAAATDSYVRAVAAELVRAMRTAAWDIYVQALHRGDAGRAETIRGLLLLRAAAELGEIALTDPAWRIRERAVTALDMLGPRDTIGPLTSVLDDHVVAVRRAAVRALARWVTDRHYARVALTTALDDPDPGIRAEARRALARVSPRP